MIRKGERNGYLVITGSEQQWTTADDSRIWMEVISDAGPAAPVEFRLRRETVEVWQRERQCAVVDRDLLRGWVHDPTTSAQVDDVVFVADPHHRYLRISLPGLRAWTIDPATERALRERV